MIHGKGMKHKIVLSAAVPEPSKLRNKIWTFFCLLTACSSSTSMAMTSSWTSPTLAKLREQNLVDSFQISLIDCLLPCGGVMGSFVGWMLLEFMGRRSTLMVAGSILVLAWGILAAGPIVYGIFAGRAIAGIAIGILNISAGIYIAEISPSSLRGSTYSFAQVCTNFGLLFEYSVGPFVSYTTLASLSLLQPLFFTLSMMILPESPYYLIANDRKEEAKDVLISLRGTDDVTEEINNIEKTVCNWSKLSPIGQLKEVFTNVPNIKAVSVVALIMVFKHLTGGVAILSYVHSIFEMSGVAIPASLCSIILVIVKLFASLLTTSLTAKFGMKKMLLVSCSGVSMFLMLMAGYFYVFDKTDIPLDNFHWFPLPAMIIYFVFLDFGISPFPSFIGAEILQQSVKSVGTALAQGTGHMGNVITMKLVTGSDLSTSLSIFSVCTLLSIPFMVFQLRDTRGLSLSQVHDKLYAAKVKPPLSTIPPPSSKV